MHVELKLLVFLIMGMRFSFETIIIIDIFLFVRLKQAFFKKKIRKQEKRIIGLLFLADVPNFTAIALHVIVWLYKNSCRL
jgi:hypothetical protein